MPPFPGASNERVTAMKLYRLIPYEKAVPDNLAGKPARPVVPEHRLTGENETIPRICVSSSLDGCLTSIGGLNIVSALDTAVSCARFSIMTFDGKRLDKKHLMYPVQLCRLDYVYDAIYTDEFWITAPCMPESVTAMYLTDFILRKDRGILYQGEKLRLYMIERSVWTHSPEAAQKTVNKAAYRELCEAAWEILRQHKRDAMKISVKEREGDHE